MPKYDYRCSGGHQYEKRESFDAPAVQECQECGAQARRVLTPPAIVFKGSGWYITDSRKSGPTATDLPGKSETPEAKTDAKPAEAKTETKAEAKPEKSTSSSSVTPAAAD